MDWNVQMNDAMRSVSVRRERDGSWRVSVDGGPERVFHANGMDGAEWIVQEGEERWVFAAQCVGDDVHLQGRGWSARAVAQDARKADLRLGSSTSPGAVKSEMPGVVVRHLVNAGDAVNAGQAVIVVEAMKMENELKCSVSGTVLEILADEGEAVQAGAVLMQIKPGDDA